MALRIEQETELVKSIQSRDGASPRGWWRWRVWVEGEEEELGRVEWVRYQLHQTFPNPTRVVTDRLSKFELQSSGWGEFTIYAAAHLADGSEQNFKHWLRLAGRPRVTTASPTNTPRGDAPKIFLAYAFADTHLAQAVGAALRASNVQVLDPNSKTDIGDKWPDSISGTLEAADVAAVFISEGAAPSLLSEVKLLHEKDIDLLPIVVEGARAFQVPDNVRKHQALYVKSGEDPIEIANRILQQRPALRAGSPTKE